jgi:integrase
VRLTDDSIASIRVPDDKNEVLIFDQDIAGFGYRIRRGGAGRFVFQYKIGSRHRRMTFQDASAASARETVKKLKARVTLGEDVARAKNEARQEAGDTFKRCLDIFLALPTDRRPATIYERKRHLLKNLKALHGLHINKEIDRRRVADELRRISATAPTQANRTRSSLIKFFNWAVSEGFMDSNVALLTAQNEEAESRERVLSDDELRAIWTNLFNDDTNADYRDIIRLLVFSACRLREISNLRWQEVNLSEAIITLPRWRTKNKKEHVVPLSPPALAILRARAKNRGDRDFIFGSGGGGFSGFSRSKRRLDAAAKLKAAWTVHDLRRTAATRMADLGVQPHVIEAVLNHVSGHKAGVAGIYNRSTYAAEKQQALAIWAKRVMQVVSAKPKRKAA